MLNLFRGDGPMWSHLLGLGALLGCALILFYGNRTEAREDRNALWSSILVSAISGTAIAIFSIVFLGSYGLAVFVGLPVYCGLLSTFLYSRQKTRPFGKIIKVSWLTIVALGLLILALAVDGVICVLMALPLALLLSLGGALLGNILASLYRRKKSVHRMLPVLIVCGSLPFLAGFEARSDLELPSSTVVSVIDIDAPPQVVWKCVPSIPIIMTEPDLIFRLGIAYPIGSEMIGNGVGAESKCILSTGFLDEKVTRWEPGRCLRFDVISCPPSMKEISIYPDLHPPHLENFMVSEWGEFDFDSLGQG